MVGCPVMARGYSVFKERGQRWPGRGKKLSPPLRGRFGAVDEVENADLPGFLRVWVLETKSVDFFGRNLGMVLAIGSELKRHT